MEKPKVTRGIVSDSDLRVLTVAETQKQNQAVYIEAINDLYSRVSALEFLYRRVSALEGHPCGEEPHT